MNFPTILKGRVTTRGKVLIFILVAPLAAYAFMFAAPLSTDHVRWAEFGSFMAGVYSPIIGAFTLLVLRQQFKLQRQLAQQQLYESRIDRAVEEFSFFADRLEKHVGEKDLPNREISQLILMQFQADALDVLNSEEFREKAKLFDQQHPKIMPTWGAIYINTTFLSMLEGDAGKIAYLSCMHKLTSIFSFKVCAALDNYHFAVTRGELSTKYEFSTPLENR
ncbi:hypothetical protein [Hydrogenophaga sp.]|uniref:hypothetical protein n=1 Tax=Hydrogenophaga sp. TaxID=1904254 RepID=UPI0025BD3D90|nr:hypothetical protein [Hydrogenophaga sp.]MBT9465512.1 hypothetical protein [Hydrogenophaga sp.]